MPSSGGAKRAIEVALKAGTWASAIQERENEIYASGIGEGCTSYLEQTKCRRVSPVTATGGT